MKIMMRLFFFTFLLSLLSCRKVIDIKLRDSDTKYVVEGVVTNEPGTCKVYLTRTKPFNEDNQFPGVSGAIVKVKDNGNEVTLTESQPGTYETKLINGTPGHIYQLSVAAAGQNFTASCTMPQPVNIDSMYISEGPFGQYKFASIKYTDPAGTYNGYRFVQYLNGVKDPAIFWDNDEFTDGRIVITQLDTGVDKKDDPRNIDSGEEVIVEMQCLDAVIYNYWYSLRTGGGQGSGNNAAPANPLTNIQGGALGYFSAHTVTSKKLIAP